jgi:prepilin-type processing-associated H-X9-DG protein
VQRASYENLHPIFQDHDAVTGPGLPTAQPQPYLNHYNFNTGIFPDSTLSEASWRTQPITYRITQIPNSSEVVAAYDGRSHMDTWYRGNAFRNSQQIRDAGNGWFWWGTQGMNRNISWYNYAQPVGHFANVAAAGHVDFRHLQGTTANILFVDGHVEPRRVGSLSVGEFCIPK